MSAEDLLTLIEEADKVLDHKISAEKTELAERAAKLQKLEARREGKISKTKPPRVTPRAANGKANGKSEPTASAEAAKPEAAAAA